MKHNMTTIQYIDVSFTMKNSFCLLEQINSKEICFYKLKKCCVDWKSI